MTYHYATIPASGNRNRVASVGGGIPEGATARSRAGAKPPECQIGWIDAGDGSFSPPTNLDLLRDKYLPLAQAAYNKAIEWISLRGDGWESTAPTIAKSQTSKKATINWAGFLAVIIRGILNDTILTGAPFAVKKAVVIQLIWILNNAIKIWYDVNLDNDPAAAQYAASRPIGGATIYQDVIDDNGAFLLANKLPNGEYNDLNDEVVPVGIDLENLAA